MLSKICGHRGAAKYAPENTISGFLWCSKNKISWSECDVQLTDKGTAVIVHDQRIDRTTNSKGKVKDLTDTDLKVLDAGSWMDQKFKDERIPTLKELLLISKKSGLSINIEMKFYNPITSIYRRELTIEIANLIRESKMNEQVLISSFDLKSLYLMKELLPEIHLGGIFETLKFNWFSDINDLDLKTIHINYEKAEPSIIKDIVSKNLIPFVYTCNDSKLIENLWIEGLGGVITDDPLAFSSV